MSDMGQNDLPPVLDEAPPVVMDVPPPIARSAPNLPYKNLAIVGLCAVMLVGIGWGIAQLSSNRSGTGTAVASDSPSVEPAPSQNAAVPPADVQPADARRSPRDQELSNVKQLSTAIAIYMADHDDIFPHPIDNLALIDPYLKNSELTKSQLNGEPYFMNRRLSGYSATAVEHPSTEPMVIGPTWPEGDRVVGFVDCHAKWVPTSSELDSLRYATPYIEVVATSRPVPKPVFGELTTAVVNGRTMLVPVGWKMSHTPSTSGIETYRWEGPEDEAYVKVDINRSGRATSLEESVLKLERGFKQSSRYRYKRTNWRTGKNAFKGGVIWNFEISKDGAPVHKRGIVYFEHEGTDYAILVSRRADSPRDYSEVFTKIWSHAGKW